MIFSFRTKLVTVFIIFVIAVFSATLVMVAVYSLPSKIASDNIKKSISLYEKEGLYPVWTGDKNKYSSEGDNFTDSIMLSNVIFPNNEDVVRKAMLNPRFHYKNSNYVQSLIRQIKGDTTDRHIIYYGRYWHGYLVVLKPLTMLLDISSIRLLNLILQVIVAAYMTMLIGKSFGNGYGFSYLLTYLLLNPVTLIMSFQFSTMYYLTNLITFLLLKKWSFFDKKMNFVYLFFLSGLLAAFFDFLTYPLLSVGIPLIILVIKKNYEKHIKNYKSAAKIITLSSLYWGVAYGFMLIAKWIVAWILTGNNVLSDSTGPIGRLQYRMASEIGGLHMTPIAAIERNVGVILKEPILLILIFSLIISLFFLNKLKRNQKNKIANYDILKGALFFIMSYPFLWYMVFFNHSFIHFWFTYRALAVTVFAGGCLVATLFSEYEMERKKNE